MKQKDILLIVVMVAIAGAISLAVSQIVFSSPKNKNQTTEIVDVITTDFPAPSPKYFNSNAINPAQPITLGTDSKP